MSKGEEMSTVLDLSKLSAAELADLQIKLADEAAWRERVEAMAADFERSIDRISAVVADRPPLPFEPIPCWGSGRLVGRPPGQRVLFGNEQYVNAGARFLADAPDSTDNWMKVAPRPEPEEPANPEPGPLPSDESENA